MLSPKGPSLEILLKKGDHSSVDTENKIAHKVGFGGYPKLYIKKLDEVDYVYDIIKKIYVTP